MVKDNFLEQIRHNEDDSVLFVIDGYDPIELGYERVKMNELLDTPISKSIRKLLSLENKVITMEEYLHMYDVCMNLFDKIIVLKNPVYGNLRLLYAEINPEHKAGLLRHFMPEDNIPDDLEIGPVERYTGIYGNMMDTVVGTMCCYNISEKELLESGKVSFEYLEAEKELETAEADTEFFNIANEVEYLRLVDEMKNTVKKYHVSVENYEYGKETIAKRLKYLNSCYPGRIFKCNSDCGNKEHSVLPEVKQILKAYWGYDQLRNFKVYDYNSLIRGKKVVQEVSQNDVIMDVIEQTENAQSNKRFRDIFVTAPTAPVYLNPQQK